MGAVADREARTAAAVARIRELRGQRVIGPYGPGLALPFTTQDGFVAGVLPHPVMRVRYDADGDVRYTRIAELELAP